MPLKNKDRNKDYLTLSFIIFFSFIFACFIVVFILFNVIKLKDLNLNNTVFASTDVTVEMLGIEDMTLSEFVNVYQYVFSPDEAKILKDSPKKNDKTILMNDIKSRGVTEENFNILFDNDFEGLKSGTVISERGFCLIQDSLADCYKQGEICNIENLCGEGTVDIDNIKFYESDGSKYIDAAVSVDIQSIRDRILTNFGYPIFQICGKLYFNCTYKISENNGVITGETVSSVIYDTDEQNTEKIIKALFIAYYMGNAEEEYVLDKDALCNDVLDIITVSLKNMGGASIKKYGGDRKDIKKNEFVIEII